MDGSPGLWISGAPHTLAFVDNNGKAFSEKARLAGNTLLWQRGDVTLRLESVTTRSSRGGVVARGQRREMKT